MKQTAYITLLGGSAVLKGIDLVDVGKGVMTFTNKEAQYVYPIHRIIDVKVVPE